MQYNNANVRRQDRLLQEEQALQVLKNGEYGVLSLVSTNDGAYGIPLNYVWDGEQSIYVHCAPEGQKLQCIHYNNKVSFCVVGRTLVCPEKFSTEYESIVLECTANVGLSADERMKALLLLVEKYSPEYKEKGAKYAEGSFARTQIIRLNIQKWSGKCKQIG